MRRDSENHRASISHAQLAEISHRSYQRAALRGRRAHVKAERATFRQSATYARVRRDEKIARAKAECAEEIAIARRSVDEAERELATERLEQRVLAIITRRPRLSSGQRRMRGVERFRRDQWNHQHARDVAAIQAKRAEAKADALIRKRVREDRAEQKRIDSRGDPIGYPPNWDDVGEVEVAS